MKALSIGYVLTLSFLLVFAVATITAGYFPAPIGPKAPEYPDTSTLDYNISPLSALSTQSQPVQAQAFPSYENPQNSYQKSLSEYKAQKKQYEEDQKNFIEAKMIPYVRNVLVAWILVFVLFEVIAMVIAKLSSAVVGAGYAFSSVFAILFLPFWGSIFAINSLVSTLSQQADRTFSIDPITRTVGIVSLLAVVVLTIAGMIFFGGFKMTFLKRATYSPPPLPPAA